MRTTHVMLAAFAMATCIALAAPLGASADDPPVPTPQTVTVQTGRVIGDSDNPTPVTLNKPVITGSVSVGSELLATSGGMSPAGACEFTIYAWARDGVEVSNGNRYSITAADEGHSLSVSVFGNICDGQPVTSYSDATAPVQGGTIVSKTVTISGSLKVGKTVKAVSASWGRGILLTYQWYAGGKAIAKATHVSYAVKASVRGKKLTVKVTGSKDGYTSVTRASKATKKVK